MDPLYIVFCERSEHDDTIVIQKVANQLYKDKSQYEIIPSSVATPLITPLKDLLNRVPTGNLSFVFDRVVNHISIAIAEEIIEKYVLNHLLRARKSVLQEVTQPLVNAFIYNQLSVPIDFIVIFEERLSWRLFDDPPDMRTRVAKRSKESWDSLKLLYEERCAGKHVILLTTQDADKHPDATADYIVQEIRRRSKQE